MNMLLDSQTMHASKQPLLLIHLTRALYIIIIYSPLHYACLLMGNQIAKLSYSKFHITAIANIIFQLVIYGLLDYM
jgi:hypothetical protein